MRKIRHVAGLPMHVRHAAGGSAEGGGAVIAIFAADDDALVGFAEGLPEHAGHAQRRVHSFGAGAGEKRVFQSGGGKAREALGKCRRRLGRGFEKGVVIRQLGHLRGRGGDQFRPAVADIHAPQAGHAVQDAVAVAVAEENAVRAGDQPDFAFVQRLMIGKRMQMVGGVHALPIDHA